MKFRSLVIRGALLSGSLIASTAASSQVAIGSDQSAASNEEIVVTATRRAQSLQDVPMSVNVTTGDQLQKLNLFDAKDIQQVSPGLELTNASGRNNTTSLRGISFDPDQGTGPAVQVYLNEIPTDAQTVYTALYDIGQIEVLRGPQGTLRGLSSPAGAITIRTRRPDFDTISGYGQATATSRAGFNVQGGVTLPFSSKFAIRAAVLVDGNRLNNVVNVNRDDRSRSRTVSGRLTLGWKPTPDFAAYLTYQYLEADNVQYQQVFGPGAAPTVGFGNTQRSGPAAAPDDYVAVSDGPARFQNKTHVLNLAADWDLGPATLSFVGAHQSSDITSRRDLDVANAIPGYSQLQTVTSPYRVNTAELRLASNGAGVFDWGLGAFYSKNTGTTVVRGRSDRFFAPAPVDFGLFLPIATNVSVPTFSETWSFNATGGVRLGELRFEGGLRYSILRKRQIADIAVSSPGFAGLPAFGIPAISAFSLNQVGIPPALQNRTDRPFTGGASVSWEPTDDLTIYAAYGHAFRSGSSGVAAPVGVSADLIRTGPEKTDSYEIGLKASLLDKKLSLNVAGFYQKYDGFLSRFNGIFYNCPDFFGSCNAAGAPINNVTDIPRTNGSYSLNYNGDATVKGVEATLEGRPTDFWNISIAASYARARYDGALLPCNDFNGDGRPDAVGTPQITGSGNVSYCRSDGRLGDLPDFSMTANSELRFPVGNVTPFVRGLISYRPGFYSERVDYDFKSRTLVNAYVGLRGPGERWELNVFARNLLNQHVITNISLGNETIASDGGPYDPGYRSVGVTNPREFGMTASFKW